MKTSYVFELHRSGGGLPDEEASVPLESDLSWYTPPRKVTQASLDFVICTESHFAPYRKVLLLSLAVRINVRAWSLEDEIETHGLPFGQESKFLLWVSDL